MKTSEITLPVMLIVGIFGGLATVLTMKSLYAGNWDNIANYLAPVSIMIAVFALVIIAIWKA